MAGYTKNKLILTGFSPGIVFLITIFLLTLVCVPDAGSVSIKTIQRGRVSIGAQDRAGIASIETVNVATSMLIVSNFATKNTADDEMAALCTAEFSSDSQIYITRNEGQGNSTNAEYMVVEFNEKVNVQGGYTKIAYNSPGRGVYLGSSVETNHAFILATTLSPVVHGTKSDMFCTYEFGANNRIDFLRNARNNQDVIEFAWYVVEFEEDVNVYHGETPLAAGTSSIPDVAIGGTVNPDKSFVIVSCRAADAASTYADIKTAAEVNTGGTTLTLSRKGSSTGAVCCWSVVEFTDGTTVQKNKIVDNAADTSDGINTSDGERAFAFINNNTATTGNQCREWQVAANVGGLSDTYSNPATTINFDRGGTALMDIVWHVVECPPVSIVAPNSNELWRVGTPYNIEWTHSDSVLSDGTGYGGSHKIRIDLSLDFGVDGYPYTIYETPASPEVSDYDCSSDSFPWTIPPTIDATDIISNNCRIKITDVDEETSGNSQSVFDISDAPFEIIADIELTYPLGGQVMAYEALPGDAVPGKITWNFSGDSTGRTVVIKYDTNSGGNDFLDGTLTTTSGPVPAGNETFSIDWVNDPLSLGDRLRIRIELVGEETRVCDESTSDFTVQPDVIYNNPPEAGEIWKIGEIKSIDWTAKGATFMTSGIDIQLSRYGGTAYATIGHYDATASPQDWTVDAPGTDMAVLKIQSVDYPEGVDTSPQFTIQQTINVDVPPVGGQVWKAKEAKNIDYTIQGTVANVDLHYSTFASPDPLNDANWTLIEAAVPGGTGSFSRPWLGGVANVLADTVWLRVRNSVETTICDVSDYSFKIAGNISISEPHLDEILNIGVQETITFAVTGNVIGTADIQLDTGSGYNTIETKAINGEGNYTVPWTPTSASHLGFNCTMRVIMQTDPDTYGISNSFKIRPNITLTYPKNQTGVEVSVDDPADKLFIKWIPEPEDLGGGGLVNIRYDLNSGLDDYPDGNVVVSNYACNTKPNAVDIGYEWQVPDTTGMVTNKMRVMVYKTGETQRTDVSDTSEVDFIVLGTLTLTGASDGDASTWKIGENKIITWTAKGDITPVNIYYSLDDGFSWNDLAIGYAAGSGDRECGDVWNPIPNTVLASVPNSIREADVKFRITGGGGSIEDISTGNITIQARIILTKPDGSSVFTVVDSGDDPAAYTENQILWAYNGDGLDTANLDIKYDTGGAGTFAGTVFTGASAVAGGWTQWVVPDVIGNQVKVKVKAQGTDGDYVYADSENFTVKGQIKIESPAPVTDPPSPTTVWTVHRGDIVFPSFDSTQNIEWRCFGTLNAGTGVNVQYASTGLELDFANIFTGVVSASGALATQPWQVPDNIGQDNKIRIVDPDAINTPADTETSAKFTIKGKLAIIRPAGGETHYVDTADSVIWKYSGDIGNIKITLDDQGGAGGYLTQTITALTPHNTGESALLDYECDIGWTTPSTAGNNYSIKIEPLDLLKADAVTTDGTNFPILGTITLVEPGMGGGETWYVNDADSINRRIDWTPSAGVTRVDIFLDTDSSDGITKERTIVLGHDQAVQKPYEWMIPDAPTKIAVTSDKCRIIIDDADDSTGLVTDQSTTDFMIKPVITPGALVGTPWQLGQSPTITWSTEGSVTNMRLYYAPDGVTFSNLEVDNILAADGQVDWYIDPTGYDKVTNGAVGKLKLVRINGAGEDADALLGPFEVDGRLNWVSPMVATDLNATGTGTIKWSVEGTVGLVAIKYSTDDLGGYPDASFTNLIEQNIAADWCEVNEVTNPNGYDFTVPSDVQPKIKIRVMDQLENEVYCESPAVCAIKGNIVFNQGTTEGQNLTVGQTNYYITWTNVGTFTGLKVSYKRVGIDTQWQEINWALAGNATQCQWIPGDNDISDDVLFRVEDAADQTVAAETNPADPNNTVVGSLELRKPILGDISDAYVVGQPGTIKWFKQGAISDLAFSLETSSGGGFFTAGTNLPQNQDPGASDFENSYTTWAVPDMITSEGRIKVTSGSLTDETIVTKEFDIKGAFNSMSTPNSSTVWKVGDDQTVTWNAVGTMSAVDIYLITPSGGEQLIANDYSGTGLIYGVNSFTWTSTGDAKQDQMTDQAQIKIVSVQHADVSITSAQFDFIPKITVNDLPATVTAETSPTITWTYTGTKLGAVDIVYDPNGDGDVSLDGVVLENGVNKDAGAGGYTPTGVLPATLLITGKILIRDATETYAYGITASSFETEGYIELTQPDGATTWKVGDSTNNILWNYKGDIGNVKVWADYDGDGVYDAGIDENLSDTMPVGAAGSGSLEWPGVIGDHVATGAKIWVESIDPIPTAVSDDSAAFNILGAIKLDTDVYGIPGKVIHITSGNTQSLPIGWYTQGSAIDQVKIQYSVNGMTGPFIDIATVANNLYGPYEATTNPLTVNTYTWDNNSAVPIPTGAISIDGVIRVIAIIGGTPQAGTSDDSSAGGRFVICGDIVINPNLDGEVWEADGATPHTITWEYAGPISTVDVFYAANGTDYVSYPALASGVDADTDLDLDNSGYYSWTIPDEVNLAQHDYLLSNGKNAKIKVQDHDMAVYAFGESQTFTVKSKLNFSVATLATLSGGLKAGTQNVDIVIERKGKTASFDLEYSKNEGGAYTSIVSGEMFVGTALSHTVLWDVPEYVGHENDGTTGYMLKVTSPDGAVTETPIFNVYGELNLTTTGTTWQMTDPVTIEWNVVHGNIVNVNVIGLRKGGTWGNATDEFPIVTNTQADNVQLFLEGGYGTYVAQGSCNWTVAEEGGIEPTIISDGVKIKVVDANSYYSAYSVEHEAAGLFIIKGKITVTTPGSDWIAGTDTEQIYWYADGDMQNVKIEFYNGTGWDIVASTTASDPGDNYFDVSNWEGELKIPDVKYEACQLKVSSIDDITTNVSDITDSTFYTYPEISSVSVITSPVIADSPVEVQWDYTSTTISTVDILIDLNGDNDWTDATVVQPVVAVAAGKAPATYTTINSLPTALSPNAKIRVRDSQLEFQDLVAGDSAGFEITGLLTINPPNSSSQWVVGTGSHDINWSYTGEIGDVRIWLDYDGDGVEDTEDVELAVNRAVTLKPLTWPGPVDDYVSTNAKVWIEAANLTNPVDSDPFNIAGAFADLTVHTSDPEVIAGKIGATTITWTRTGVGITEALLEYSFDGTNWNPLDDELGTVGLVNNTGVYNWTPLDTDIDETCWVRISDPDNSSATDQFGPFTMTSMIEVYRPDSNNVGPNAWDSGTTKRISWSKYGDFANVKIYYSHDGVDWSHEIDPAVSKSSNVDLGDVDGGGAGTEDGYFDYDWVIDDTVTLSPTAKIKVVDSEHETYGIPGVSDQFTTKGNVEVLLPDGTGNYVAGEEITLRWKRWGNIVGVNVYYYSAASGEVAIPSLQGIDFVGAATEHEVTWTPPEIIGTDYVIRVKDKSNEVETQDDSVPFILEGKLAITDPNGQGETMYIRKPADSLKTITWNVVHGNIQNVKIIGTRTDTFPDPAGDFVVVDSTDADNVLTFSASNFGTEGCVARGSYDWNIQEPAAADSIISDTVRLKILDENTDYSVESLPSSALFKIKGQIVVDSPATDWNVDAADKNISWTAYGDIQNVLIKFDNGTTVVDVVNPATGTPSGEGAKSFPVTSWTYNNDGNVPDVRSLNCQFQVIDFNDQANVSGISGTFGIYPVISNAAVSVTPQVADIKPIVSWNYTGSTITAVDILVDLNGDDNYSDAVVLQNNVPIGNSPHETANKLPTTLSDNAKILVRDHNLTFQDYIKDDTAPFVITGEIVVSQPNASLDPKWKIEDVNKDIVWTYKGAIGDVNIKVDYDGDGTYDQPLATVGVDTSPWPWPAIPNQVSNNAMIKIESVDKPGDIFDESEPFNIIGEVAFTNVTGQMVKVKRDGTHFMDIEWTTKGNGITKVKLEYTPTGLAQDYVEISSNIDNTFTDGATLNSFTWDALDAVPIPTDVASVLVKLRISASTPLQPETTNESSGNFVICGNTYVQTPSGGEKWLADGTTSNRIEWEIAGKVDNVKILYAQDGTNFLYPITNSTDADNQTLGQYGYFDWTIPSNVTDDLVSNAQAKIRIQDANSAFETNVVDTSQPFTIKGVLTFDQTTLDALAAGLTAGDNQGLTWSRKGKIGAVHVLYSRDNGSTFPNPIQEPDVAFDIGVATKTITWSMPEYIGCQAGLNGYAIRIEDITNSETKADTPVFTVSGELLGTNTSDTWSIGTPETITWNVVHGNIANVNIIGSRDGTWGGAAEFTIANNQDAHNVTAFAEANFDTLGYAAKGSYPWNIIELAPSIISDAVKLKILDADTNYSIESVPAATFSIKGRFEVTAPALGDTIVIEDITPFNITWNKWGDISDVKIEYSTDSTGGVGGTWNDVIASTDNDGVYEWTAPATVPITSNLYIKVTDITVAGGVYDVSEDAVSTKGWFEFSALNSDTPDTNSRWDVSPSAPHEIKWTKHGNTPTVKIEYSPDGSTYYDVSTSTANTGTYDWSPDPDTTNLSAGKTATIRVSEVGDPGNFAVSPVFRLIGKIALLNPTGGEAYSFGDSETIRWQVTGKIQNVRIDFSADGDLIDYEQLIVATTPAGGGAVFTYPWDIQGPTSTDVVLRISDVLDSTVNVTSDDLDPIKIMVVYTIDSPADGNVWAVGSSQTISWRTLQGISPQVKLEYKDNLAVWQPFDGGTGIINNDGEEPWTVPNNIMDGCQLRISDPRDYPGSIQVMDTTNNSPVVTEEYFKIRGDLVIKEPNTAVNWNISSSHDIVFTTTGSISSVKLEYSIVGGGLGNYPASPALPFNPIATGVVPVVGGDKTIPWTIPDALTIQARVRVVDENDATVYDEADVNFTIRDVLTFDAGTFTAGENMFVYDNTLSPVKKTINWSMVGSISKIKLEYSVDGAAYQTITGADNLNANLGTFDWEVSDAINTNPDSVLVRISTTNAVDEPALAAVSPGFNVKGVLKLNEPPAILYVDDTYTITWQKSGSINNVELQYSVGGAGFNTLADTGAGNVDISGAGPDYIFDWKVPNQINGNIVLKVVDVDDSTVSDVTNPFRIAGALKLLTPNGGSYYEVDQGCAVTWEVHGTIAQVDLYYDTNGSLTYSNFITTLNATPSSWSWPVDVYGANDIGKQVRMKIEDHEGAAFTRADTSDTDFEIRGKLTVTSPEDGNIWLSTSTTDPITWTKNGALSTVKIELDINDGNGYQPLADAGADSVDISGAGPVYSFNWTVPSIQSTQAKIKVTDLADATGNTYDESEGFFTIRAGFKWLSPEESPASGVNPMVATDAYVLSWQTFGSVPTVKIFYSTNLGNSWKDLLDNGAPISDPATEGMSILNEATKSITVLDDIASVVYLKILDATNPDAQAELQNCRIQGELTIKKPDASTIWLAGGTGRIEWTMKGTLDTIKIDYSKNSGGSFVAPNGGVIYNSVSAAPLFAEWAVIPGDAISANTVVRITDTSNPDVTDQHGDFPIKASFSLITPKDTDTWIIDDPEDITWTTIGAVAKVNLYYYKQSIDDWVLINETAEFDNNSAGVTTYPWQVADNVSDNVKIRIVDAADPTATGDSLQFKIRGSLNITQPNEGYVVDETEKFVVGRSHNILWEPHGTVGNIYMQYFKDPVWVTINNPATGLAEIPNTGGLAWIVPDTLTNTARIKITSVDWPDITDTSDADFKIMGGFTVINPPAGDAVNAGDSPIITWSSTSSVANVPNVNIDLSLNSGGDYLLANRIAANTPNDGQHQWGISTTTESNDKARIRISDAADPDAFDETDSDFRIRVVLQLLSPNNGTERWEIGRENDITWACTGDIPNVQLEYSLTGNFLTSKKSIGIFPNDATKLAKWIIPDDSNISDTVLVRVSDPNDYEARDDSDNTFRITAGFDVISPNGAEDWDVGSQPTITWTCTSVDVPSVRIAYSTNGGAGWKPDIVLTDNDGSFQWTTGVDDQITTQARIKVYDSADTTALDISDDNFNIMADFDIRTPNGGQTFTVEDITTISWDCVGSVSKVQLEYSTNGTDWNPIASDIDNTDTVGYGDGVEGSYSWTVDDAISATVKVRVSDFDAGHPYADDDSDADFRIKGDVWMKAPGAGESWDIGQDYDIKWGWIGTIPEVKITYSTNGVSGPFDPVLENHGTANDGIIANAAGSGGAASEATFMWTIPDEAAADTVIRIVDIRGSESDVTDDSGSFHIVGYIIAKKPVSTDVLEVGKPFDIKWEWGGTMPEVKITYSTNGIGGPFNPINENYGTANDGIVANGAGGGGPGSEATYTWTVPDDISTNCVIKISDPNDATVNDDTQGFKIVGVLTLTYPNGGERLVTRDLHNITWTTGGTISDVKLLYSKDDFVSDSNPIVASVANTDSYPWPVDDDRSTTVKIRVQDAADPDVYDDSDANFTIDYYTINWVIRDLLTNIELAGLTVEAVSDKGDEWKTSTMPDNPAAPLGSPVTVELPYGFWTAIWSKTEYGDKQLNFMCDSDKTLDTIYMETSAIHIWRAYSEFTYDAASDDLKVTSWLERDGSVVSGAATVDVDIYDDTGTLIKTLSSSTPNSAGFFNLSWQSSGLQSSVLYSTLTIIKNASGAEFKTPSSFSITETKQLKATEAAVQEMRDTTLPAFQVAVQKTIDDGVAEQKKTIVEKMNEQTSIIETKTEEMKTSVDATLTSFEERTDEAITELKKGAEKATQAGESLETIANRQSGELILPNSVLVGGNVEIRYRNKTGLLPLMDIIAYDGTILFGAQPLFESATTPGLYGYDLIVDGATFLPGKAFTVIVTENTTGNLQAGSVMVESTSLTSIEGLASSIPQIKSITDEALVAIKGVEGTLATGGDVGKALDALQESINDFPDFMDQQGTNDALVSTMNEVSKRLTELAGSEGFDISGMVEAALEESPTIKELKKKTENIKSIVKFLQALFEHKFGGVEEEPVISTSLSSGSLVVNVVAANPSSTKPQKTKVKIYLPKEVTPDDLIDLGGLDIEFDATKSIYYVFKDEIELAPKEVRVYKVEIEDIWFVSQTSIDVMKLRATKLAEALEDTEYEKETNKLVDDINKGLDEIVKVQNDIGLSREQHIGAYRVNIKKMEEFKSSLTDMEKLMIKRPDQLGALTKAMTWKVILLVIAFIGLLAAVFFFTWYRKSGLTEEAIEKAKQFSFPEEGEEDKK